MTSTDSTPANRLSVNWSRIWCCNHKRDIFPRSKGRVVPTNSVPKLLCYIASFAGFTNRMHKRMHVELQSLICWLLLPLFPGRYQRADEAWARSRQRSSSRKAVLTYSPWSRNNAEQGEGPVPDWPLRSPGGMQNTWGSDARQIISHPKSQSLVSGETNGSQVSQSELNCSRTHLC